MWRELPPDTKWFEVELTAEDLARIRFFPRAQWRRVADGSFYLVDVVERIRRKLDRSAQGEFFDKLRRLSYSVQDDVVSRTVLLIGADPRAPLTILDGNHRMAVLEDHERGGRIGIVLRGDIDPIPVNRARERLAWQMKRAVDDALGHAVLRERIGAELVKPVLAGGERAARGQQKKEHGAEERDFEMKFRHENF